jgi:glycyl-tRNA synthetase alpha chain
MVLQRVDSIYDIEWAPGLKYSDVRMREEIEQSKYVFGQVAIANADFGAFHRDLFDRYYQLATALLEAQLIWPALEHCLKCSHLFNVLDSSNSIGVTERTAFILRIRQLAIGIAKTYVEGGAPPAADEVAKPAVAAGGGG